MDCSHPFKLVSPYKPTGDQPEAIKKVLEGVQQGKQVQVILGATGTGKTFTDANIVATLNRPTLILVHNKTLASQLYGEFKELFPENRVEYFVSNFDFYQPEAYIPKTDTYIDKNAVMKWYDYIFIVVSLIIIVLSLLQGGKSSGASGAITGGGLNVFAKKQERGSEKVVTWLTFGFAVVFLFLALLISVYSAK